jgi:formamidopyrimidine-DNA glycosylase
MPELPDIVNYIEALRSRIGGHALLQMRIENPFVLRTVDPPPDTLIGRPVAAIRRMGKRIVLDFGEELFLVIHLMIAGRLRWVVGEKPKIPAKLRLASLQFEPGTLVMTEAGSKRRASLHVVRGEGELQAIDRGGLEVLECSAEDFRSALRRENHTLKRTLTDPRVFSGIGNAYSDEILHRARLSPLLLTSRITDEEADRLFEATRTTLEIWTDRIRAEAAGGFPEHVTAFREGMAVHGRFQKPCPDCGSAVQRIVYAENETNYCARCQTGGRLLADRALSRLLKSDWPRSLDEL